jgi:DNA-3-methyladenine glycosylase II
MPHFQYGQTELAYLKKQDEPLGQAIDRIGMIERPVIPDLFAALVQSMVAQQISSKAAATVWTRMQARFGTITPKSIAAIPVEEIQQCGLSMRKAGYIKSIGDAVIQGELDISRFHELPDEEIIQCLSAQRGVGIWTAEMLLIFSMQRPNVVSWGDLAIRRGMIRLYGHAQLDKAQFDRYKQRYSPYGSVASLYLWEIAIEPSQC